MPLAEEVFVGQTVDRCRSCQGAWFDQRELGFVLSADRLQDGDKRPGNRL
ncbi:MAG: zf-TFIIB domain-containing protein [Pirellulales bacterium]|nr:zf-TFIIB domain-containing protein [Pirellulales bacterium]